MSEAITINDYSTGLLSCFSDCGICVQTCFCPCVTKMMNTSRVHDQECDCDSCCICNSAYWDRQLLRARKNMVQDKCGDCCVCCFCRPCMLCQDAREIKRGFSEPLRKVSVTRPTKARNPRTQIHMSQSPLTHIPAFEVPSAPAPVIEVPAAPTPVIENPEAQTPVTHAFAPQAPVESGYESQHRFVGV